MYRLSSNTEVRSGGGGRKGSPGAGELARLALALSRCMGTTHPLPGAGAPCGGGHLEHAGMFSFMSISLGLVEVLETVKLCLS